MNYFEHQDQARLNSKRLLAYFFITVLLIVGAVDLLIIGIWMYSQNSLLHGPIQYEDLFSIVLFSSLITITMIASASLYRIFVLRKGGQAVAKLLKAVLVDRNSQDPNEKRLLNIVEEMSIASGIPVPQVYLLKEESAINAMVAGHDAETAVIIVTQGCLEQLSRDELQGVIGHEFSHIFNGDMKLNIKLLGALNGILILSSVGYGVIRITDRKSSSNNLGIVAVGGALIIIGYVGSFFGQLIKSAVSRQREYLADAAAVQLTRNPLGIKGALLKIAGATEKKKNKLKTFYAGEMSHMFFAESITAKFSQLLASHPPLNDRIKRIDPSSPEFIAAQDALQNSSPQSHTNMTTNDHGTLGMAAQTSGAVLSQAAPSTTTADCVAATIAAVGAPTQDHLNYAAKILKGIPQRLQECSRSAVEAKGVIYGLLLNRDDSTKSKQIRVLSERGQADEGTLALSLLDDIKNLASTARFSLIELCIPSLKTMPSPLKMKFLECIEMLINADENVTLFESGLEALLIRSLTDRSVVGQMDHFLNLTSSPIQTASRHLFSYLTNMNFPADSTQAQQAFDGIMNELGYKKCSLMKAEKCSETQLLWDLKFLNRLKPLEKSKIVECCIRTILSDGQVTPREAETAQVLCAALDCPLPPILNLQ